MKKVLAVALAGILSFSLAACSQPAANANADAGNNANTPATEAPAVPDKATDLPQEPDTQPIEVEPTSTGSAINVFKATTPETIDPTMNTTVDGGEYCAHLFEGLMRYKWDGSGIENGMAESYTISDDGLVWTFKLRDSLWSDGQPVKADDFVYAWRRMVDPTVAAPYGSDMGGFLKNGLKILDGALPKEELGVKAIDDKTLEVTLEAPTAFFGQLAAFATFSPVREDTITKNGDSWIRTSDTYITNGPFKMLSYATDDKMVIVPNPGYYDIDKILPSQITFYFLADDTAALAAFRSGEIDYMDTPPIEEREALKNDGLFGTIPELGTYYVSFNTQIEPLNNVNVRKALTLAIDTAFIAGTIQNGTVEPAVAFVGDGFATTNYEKPFRSDWQTYMSPADYEKNKEIAKQALADAGYPNGQGFPALEYLYNTSSAHQSIGEALQNMWKEVLNIDVQLKNAEWAVVSVDRREGNFQLARNGWIADYNDPATMLSLFTSTSGNNDGKVSIPAFDDKMAESNQELDPAKRNQLLHEAEDILLGQEWAMAPIYYYTINWASNPKLKGWGVTPLGYQFYHTAYLEQ